VFDCIEAEVLGHVQDQNLSPVTHVAHFDDVFADGEVLSYFLSQIIVISFFFL